jgi:hypothetical protein
VVFWNCFTKFPNGKESCQNEMNLIKIFLCGMEILVELSGELMGPLFIDVLVFPKLHKDLQFHSKQCVEKN